MMPDVRRHRVATNGIELHVAERSHLVLGEK